MTTFALARLDQPESQFNSDGSGGFGALQAEAGNLPLKQLGYSTRIVGLACHTTIVQTFYNPFDECLEATYVFPIEVEQAVVDCEMRVANRVVRAILKERSRAQGDYRNAIARGHRAAILEENRPETFSMKVGNIAPGEVVQTRIETIGRLPVVHGEWTLRLPLVVAPRYTSGFPVSRCSVGSGTQTDTVEVPDASTVTPPTLLPGFPSPIDLRLEIELQMGSLSSNPNWPRELRSSLHSVVVDLPAAPDADVDSCRIRVQPGERVDRDFILRGQVTNQSTATSLMVAAPPARTTPENPTPLSQDPTTADSVFALHVVPPTPDVEIPRDVVFVLDRSGSMGGWKMKAARRSMSRFVDSLGKDDRFQVLAFDDRIEMPFDVPGLNVWVDGTDDNRFEAVRFLSNVGARGGTELGLALKRALEVFGADIENVAAPRSRAIVLITDGQITGEDSVIRLLGTIPAERRPRIFCLGIDRAVNASALQRLAKNTGGLCELVESEPRLDEVMQRFGDELGEPAVVDLQIAAVEPSHVEMLPTNLPDLYGGRAASIYGRCTAGPLSLKITGRQPSGALWEQVVSSSEDKVTDNANLLWPLWGRNRLRELEDRMLMSGQHDRQQQAEIVRCSLECNVLSRLTAFVAVDESEIVSDGHQPHRVLQPVELPAGWLPAVASLGQADLIPMPGRPVLPTNMNIFSRADFPNLGEVMQAEGIISDEQLAEARQFATESSLSLGQALETLGYASPEETARSVAQTCKLPYLDLLQTRLNESVIELVPESVARENEILPYSQAGDVLTVLVHDPSDLEVVEKLRFILNCSVETIVASRAAILESINRYYGQIEGESADSMLQEFTDTAIDFTETEEDCQYIEECASAASSPLPVPDDAPNDEFGIVLDEPYAPAATPAPLTGESIPVRRLTLLMMAEAVQLRATHILLRWQEDCVAVFYLIDGDLVERDRLPLRMKQGLLERLLAIAGLKPLDATSRQTGSFVVTAGDKTIESVLYTVPQVEGEFFVLVDMLSEHCEEEPEIVREWKRQHSVAPAKNESIKAE